MHILEIPFPIKRTGICSEIYLSKGSQYVPSEESYDFIKSKQFIKENKGLKNSYMFMVN